MKKDFLERATNLKAANEEFHSVHSNAAFDGIRIHVDNSLPACTCEFCTLRVLPILTQGRAAKNTVFTITTAALVTACKQALAIGKSDRASHDYIPPLRLSVNGSLKYFASSEENGSVDGEWTSCTWETTRKTIFPAETVYKTAKTNGITVKRVKVEYSHEGQDLDFGISPKYLLEAIEGMGETVTLKINVRNSPLHVTDGTREAIIMPIRL